MNLAAGTGLVALAGGLLWFFVEQKPADVYDMPVEQAYAQLSNVDFTAWGSEGRSSVGNGSDKLTWRSVSNIGLRECELKLAPYEGDAARTHIAVTCGGDAGAEPSFSNHMFRNHVIEQLDATLTGRTFDKGKIGETSQRWPSDGVDASMGGVIREANKIQAEHAQSMSEIRDDAEMNAFYSE